MTELIPINKADFNGAEINSVNARELHEVLESKQDFSTWIKKRLDEVDAVENVDFICFHKKMEANNATMIEYILSTDIAKEIAMLERNEVGKKVRRYFIEFEKTHKQKVIPLTQAEILAQSAALLVEHERRTAALETKTEEIRKEQLKAKHNINRLLNNDNYMTLIAFMNLHGISQKGYHIPSLGKRAKKLSDEQGAFMGAVIDPRYGRINTYSTEILKQIFKVA
ncbi:antA/AntB antirepressor family protein [uncultured Campylobacter sp.]|jgi:hypothetical protein|uniref:antA/AntB antirepressor family protein n=1 Tax=uncultured Campylobacter sp. TaxID=218934 RepID=UPI0025D8B3F4|nr:antA/AntB antirepressor family protein [uncultured Campylobacter sp.]